MAESATLESPPPEVRPELPVFSHEDFDFVFDRMGWPVALHSTCPEELKKRIAAARVSYHGSYSSMDYVYKTYLKKQSYEVEDGSRLDLRIDRCLKNKMEMLSELILRVTALGQKRTGEMIGEWTYIRVPFTIGFLVSCAHKGVLFESIAIARMLIEQIAWSIKVDGLIDTETIQGTSATKAIGAANSLCPVVGRFYGWLSAHAHWAYDGHIKAMHFEEDGRLGSLFASSNFKKEALAVVMVAAAIGIRCFISLKQELVDSIMEGPEDKPNLRFSSDTLETRLSVSAIRSIGDFNEMLGLMDELARVDNRDSGMSYLQQTLADCCN